jgi:hypothetical protein
MLDELFDERISKTQDRYWRYCMKFVLTLLGVVVYSLIASASITNCRAATVEEITLYSKPDRQKILVDGARKEGKNHVVHVVDRRSSRAPGEGRL